MSKLDEAVDAAVEAMVATKLGDRHGIHGEEFVEAARAALEAAAPLLMTQAWDEGHRVSETAWAHAYDGHPVRPGEMCDQCVTENPYRPRHGGAR